MQWKIFPLKGVTLIILAFRIPFGSHILSTFLHAFQLLDVSLMLSQLLISLYDVKLVILMDLFVELLGCYWMMLDVVLGCLLVVVIYWRGRLCIAIRKSLIHWVAWICWLLKLSWCLGIPGTTSLDGWRLVLLVYFLLNLLMGIRGILIIFLRFPL